MRGRFFAIIVAVLWGAISPASAQTRFEQDVLTALNAVRADPAGFADALQHYRGFFRANMIVLPGDPVRHITQEGVAPVDEAIGFLRAHAPLGALVDAGILAMSASDHVADQSVSGATGHYGRTRSSPVDRVRAHGGGGAMGEVIAYGASGALDVIRMLIIDDGVRDRGHRRLLFDAAMRFAGVSCGPHPVYRTMCVIDMAGTSDARPAPFTLAQADTASRVSFQPAR